MSIPWLAFIESNTSGTGALFARAAARLGCRPILLTADPSRYKYVEDEKVDVLRADTQNEHALYDACLQLAASSKLAGITSSSEYFIQTAASLARRFLLPGPNPGAIGICRDKRAQRLRLQAKGIGTPAFRSASSVNKALAAACDLGFPVIVKPVSGSGSSGVKLCENANDVATHAGALLKQRRNERGLPVPRRILVEEVALGPEYSVEAFGKEVIGITKKHLGAPPYFVEVGHDYPAILPAEARKTILETVSSALEAFELDWGPAHVELRLTQQGPKIIEVNPRLAGGYIPELVRLASGVDLICETIRLVIGEEPRLKPSDARYASIRFILPPCDGTLLGFEGLDDIKSIPELVEVEFYCRPGHYLRRQNDFRDRIGNVIAAADSPEAARAAVERAHSTLRLRVEAEVTVAAQRA